MGAGSSGGVRAYAGARARAFPTLVPWAWSLALAVLMLGPALGPGYVLTYDMVWVPDLVMRSDFLGLAASLPRAVPSDAVVALLDEVVPGAVLQDLVLAGLLTAAGAGAARLPGTTSWAGRLAAATVYVWNPFVAERLVLGHWPVLVGYAVLPWLVAAGRRARDTGRLPVSAWVLVPLGSLSAGAGLVTAAVLVAVSVGRGRRRTTAEVAAVVIAANAPWVVSGLLHASAATSAEVGARLFALHGAGPLPAPLAALGLGGTWNAEVVLPSRDGPLAVVGLVLLLAMAAWGWPGLRAAVPRRDLVALVGCWTLGWGLAVLTWAAPGAVGWLVAHVPGAGLLRDGARFLALCAPLLAASFGQGVARTAALAPGAAPRAVLAGGLVLLPVATLPDAAGGASGRLEAVDYPDDYEAAAAQVREALARGQTGDALLLPFEAYRAPEWNGGRSVLNPLGRYLPVDYIAADDLVVSGTTVPGEDPRAREVGVVLEGLEGPAADDALARRGIGFVADDEPFVTVRPLDGVVAREPPLGWVVAMSLAWGVYAVAPASALATGLRRAWSRRRGATGLPSRSPGQPM